jgi:mRNA deadenylase 3'-5' endonuclease subunit Ccr4
MCLNERKRSAKTEIPQLGVVDQGNNGLLLLCSKDFIMSIVSKKFTMQSKAKRNHIKGDKHDEKHCSGRRRRFGQSNCLSNRIQEVSCDDMATE